jgi:putative protease
VKITAPLSRLDEVEMLIGSGADELYCGLVPERWMKRFTRALWLNRRDPRSANFTNEDDLVRAIETAHGLGAKVFLTLNAPFFTAGQQGLVLELADWAAGDAGVDALIVADLGLLAALSGRLPKGTGLHTSTVGNASNREAVEHWADLGVERVILPRHLSIEEIGRLVLSVGQRVELEAFVLNDTCVYEEGFCHTMHGVDRLGAFCLTPWEYEIHPAGAAELGDADRRAWDEHLADYEKWLWYCNSCGCTMSEKGLPLGPCGLCAIKALDRAGVTSVKIVGREAASLRKLRSVQLVKRVVERVDAGATEAEAAEWAREIRDAAEHCRARYMCYYRECAPDAGTVAVGPAAPGGAEEGR